MPSPNRTLSIPLLPTQPHPHRTRPAPNPPSQPHSLAAAPASLSGLVLVAALYPHAIESAPAPALAAAAAPAAHRGRACTATGSVPIAVPIAVPQPHTTDPRRARIETAALTPVPSCGHIESGPR
ncbi:hypothetical protein [Streptomyces yangpuensis]|uniref:hypothetical protein n=1 Tax=Streptomyces yangpuensis TaxID=1648182 RepID=UPI00381F2F45